MKVLLAVDDSQFSEAATQAVVQHVRAKDAEVYVLNVVDLALPIPTSYAAGFRQESLRQGNELVQGIEEVLQKAGYTVQTAVEEGYPKSVILDRAARWNADLIVVGTHGRRGADRFLMGSVAESVARHAPCSVLIVRNALIR